MGQVERGFLQRFRGEIVRADFQVGPAVPVQEPRIKISGDDPAGAAYLVG